jgi:hypothetical protein
MKLNLAYKHLESKLRIADLTIAQWLGIFAGVISGLLWMGYLSPFGMYLTIITAVYVAGIPVLAAFLASFTDFDIWLHVRAIARYRRTPGRYVPGPGDSATGYVVEPDERDDLVDADLSCSDLDLAELFQ